MNTKSKKLKVVKQTTTKVAKIAYDPEDIFFDYKEFIPKPAPKAFVLDLGRNFIKWCKNSDGLKAGQFFRAEGIDSRTYYRWMERYPEFRDLYNFGLELLGDKREIGAIKREYSEKVIMRRMHAYDPEWRESDKYHADLKNTEMHNMLGNITIIDHMLTDSEIHE